MTPGPSEIFSPLPWRTQFRHPPASTTRTESVTAWPERLVPAARNVTGMRRGGAVRRGRGGPRGGVIARVLPAGVCPSRTDVPFFFPGSGRPGRFRQRDRFIVYSSRETETKKGKSLL